MSAAAKSILPTFAAFMVAGVTYTTIVARKEGNSIDAARTRWQQQKSRGDHALSAHGATLMADHA